MGLKGFGVSVRSEIVRQIGGMCTSSGEGVPNLHQILKEQLIQNMVKIYHSKRKEGRDFFFICLDIYKHKKHN